MNNEKILEILLRNIQKYNTIGFIAEDPISVPHQFSVMQDKEIAGFFAAILAWGNRKTIINSANRILEIMDNTPYQFITQHQETDLKKCMGFVHRTFNATDLLHCIRFLQFHYTNHASLESAFTANQTSDFSIEKALIGFHHSFFSLEYSPERTKKHIPTPERKSACKRLNMYLRWMVRKDNAGVDFGIWNNIPMSSLILPLDIHVANVSERLGLLPNCKSNWANAVALTSTVQQWNPEDPAIFDFALFSLGVIEKF
jgi:uncharacterized protein (TIGR02757 family)